MLVLFGRKFCRAFAFADHLRLHLACQFCVLRENGGREISFMQEQANKDTKRKKPFDRGEMPPVKVLERKLAHKGSVLDIYDDYVEVGGHKVHWDFIHHNGAAAVLPVRADGKILMVRQYRHALERFTLEIPAGKVDSPDEPKIDCARRELEEETGYRAGKLTHLLDINTTVAFCDEFIGIYLAEDLTKTAQHLDEDEQINVEAWALSDLLELIFTKQITDAKTAAAILAYAYQKRVS